MLWCNFSSHLDVMTHMNHAHFLSNGGQTFSKGLLLIRKWKMDWKSCVICSMKGNLQEFNRFQFDKEWKNSDRCLSALRQHVCFFYCIIFCKIQSVSKLFPSWWNPLHHSFLSPFWQSCCVTALTHSSSHSEEPARPLSVPGIRTTLSTLRFSLRDVAQPQQRQACPNTGCGPLGGKLIGLFIASHHVRTGSSFSVFSGQHPVTLHMFSCFHTPGDDWTDVSL